jgi:8-oxo-dGTP pyrophosphatase MutT (NUDIX family)
MDQPPSPMPPIASPDPAAVPVYKVGAVFLRGLDTEFPEVLIIRPKPKIEGELPPYVLPRGSRQYWDKGADGKKHYHDVRDAKTALAHAPHLEPLTRTLLRESYEEAGIHHQDLRQQEIYEVGPVDFTSKKGTYPIHWFVVLPSAAAQERMLPYPPDALETRWETVENIESLIEQGLFSPGYLPVIQSAVHDAYYERKPVKFSPEITPPHRSR